MPFYIPSLTELIEKADMLMTTYKNERSIMDENRFLAHHRQKTHNPSRMADISFISSVAKHVEKNQNDCNNLLHLFPLPATSEQIIDFLRKTIAGAFLLHARKISKEYTFEGSVKNRSALAKVILNLFTIEKFSDIPKTSLDDCLLHLKSYLQFMTTHTGVKLRWHKEKTNTQLFQELDINNSVPYIKSSEYLRI